MGPLRTPKWIEYFQGGKWHKKLNVSKNHVTDTGATVPKKGTILTGRVGADPRGIS